MGPFPAVLDIFGGAGGLFEHRAALMASRGFLTLALAYLQYNGLPRFYEELDYDYFQVSCFKYQKDLRQHLCAHLSVQMFKQVIPLCSTL